MPGSQSTSRWRCEWQLMFTATGRLAMWQGWVSTCAASAVMVPPRPAGPMPRRLTASRSSASSAAKSGRGAARRGAQRRLLGQQRAISKVPPMPTPTTIGGQGFGPAWRGLEHEALHAVAPVGRAEHAHGARVLAAAALGRDTTRSRSPGTIVVWTTPACCRRCFPPADRRGDDRGAQEPFRAAAADPLVHRRVQVAAGDVQVLSDLQEHDGEAGVLAERHAGFAGQFGVLEQLVEDVAPIGRFSDLRQLLNVETMSSPSSVLASTNSRATWSVTVAVPSSRTQAPSRG